MAQAKTGDTVRLRYKGSLEDGTVFTSSEGKDPLEFTLGNGEVIPGLEQGILGMDEGASKTISIPPDGGFGERNEQLVASFDRSDLPDHISPEVGMRLTVQSSDGRSLPVTIIEVDDDTVTFDGNHPLAGRKLTFEVTLLEILAA